MIKEFQLRIGDMVYLDVPAVRQGRNRKLASQWTDPYTITDRVSKYNVRLQLVGGVKQLVVHVNRVKPCYGLPVTQFRTRQ